MAGKVVVTPARCVRGGEGIEVWVGAERGGKVCVVCGAGSGPCGRREREGVCSAKEVSCGDCNVPGTLGVTKVGPGFESEAGAFLDEEDHVEGGGEFECVGGERGLREGGVEGDGDVWVENLYCVCLLEKLV